ncbi:metal-dependent phosphohydrolase [Oceanibacterium hippocampi]|uniref:HD/PDEase domain-containing protein n=1 Tax=Oceanibacterium hippocampi TaxID=745714 RepID=A0A1Y5T509_9PROT|nr:metal-dependent phosphohydrolase [Oceanibacterium hippocampi]SLN55942.1 hypothetical protein OCH7691_02407 [Oceanibacterium hippocampi]
MEAFDAKGILVENFVGRLEAGYRRLFGDSNAENANLIRTSATMAMEIISNSDALYHNVEHSMLVTLVGQEMLRGKFLSEGSVSERDWVHFVISLLCHDIGYVRGICPGDRPGHAVIDGDGNTIEIPAGATDAFLTPHHVERGKLFVLFRFRDHPLVDCNVIADNIERTRFPVPANEDSEESGDYPGLIRAADLVGQLADPDYLTKVAALYHEFAETGANRVLGATSPEDLRETYPDFFWSHVSDHVATGLRYLRVTREGRHWEAGLYSHVFTEEHRHAL